jgi:IS5 family transposase
MRYFCKLSFEQSIPDHTRIINFRHSLERHCLGRQAYETINQSLEEPGVFVKEGSSIDARIIEAPSSTKNKLNQRDPEMHQTMKTNQWHFGRKAHIGIDVKSGMTHKFTITADNAHDLNKVYPQLDGEQKYFFDDAGYPGAQKGVELSDKKTRLVYSRAVK